MSQALDLDLIRQQIDKLDSELVELLAKRSALTAQVGRYKSKTGLPIYVPEREATLIADRRKQAEQLGVSAELVEDILRRMMRESYVSQDRAFMCCNPDVKKVVVIGGGSSLGQRFVQMLTKSGYPVSILERDDWSQAEQILAGANLVLVAVPINITDQVINRLPELPDNCILADLTSTKAGPMKQMLAKHQGPVVGLHPMFGPDVSCMVKQIVIICHGRQAEKYDWLLQQIKTWGVALHTTQPQQHDEVMGFIQMMRHFTSFVYGNYLHQEQPDLSELLACSSPIYRLELAMVGRLFAQNASLYADIIFSSPHVLDMLSSYKQQLEQALGYIENNDKEGFIQAFEQTKAWFGDYAGFFLNESRNLLLKAHDDRDFKPLP